MIIHFGCILLYSNPFVTQKNKAEYYSQAYVYPYFHQSWNLFAPAPTTNYKLYCEYADIGEQKSDLFSEIKLMHQTNRLKGYEPLLVAFSNSIYYFEKASGQQPLNGPIQNDVNFNIIEKLSKNYLEYSRKIRVDKLKLILVVNENSNSKQRVYFN
ncbi:MAG: hypothetical protein H0U95_01785 [Bacteroidetes bacterium]|nr:hypothetical protein [Bacteroidota bacterium]